MVETKETKEQGGGGRFLVDSRGCEEDGGGLTRLEIEGIVRSDGLRVRIEGRDCQSGGINVLINHCACAFTGPAYVWRANACRSRDCLKLHDKSRQPSPLLPSLDARTASSFTGPLSSMNDK